MKRIASALTLAAALSAVLAAQQAAPTETLIGPGPSAARFPKNADEFDQLFQQVKNWGRWGPDDQLGAANLITEAKRKQAFAGEDRHRRVARAQPAERSGARQRQPVRAHDEPGASTDTYRVCYHGYAHSHMDALCHILYKDQTYNGYARAEVQHREGLHASSASRTSATASSRAAS